MYCTYAVIGQQCTVGATIQIILVILCDYRISCLLRSDLNYSLILFDVYCTVRKLLYTVHALSQTQDLCDKTIATDYYIFSLNNLHGLFTLH